MSTAGKITTKGVRKEAGLGGQPDDVKLVHIFINIIFACSILSIFYASLYAKTKKWPVGGCRLKQGHRVIWGWDQGGSYGLRSEFSYTCLTQTKWWFQTKLSFKFANTS